ncbi:hypothetical protein PsorP6_009884 [Peronosclerospora sorghi]|uniref:Uncharacterized protein n=1 Tax=Peronosclerospora sorghi TaxID=230839 RepID=A0ACC0W057_9STRA|nr:hypothetical protein PsorP6_009884 [Peronosclerospora sorghi]
MSIAYLVDLDEVKAEVHRNFGLCQDACKLYKIALFVNRPRLPTHLPSPNVATVIPTAILLISILGGARLRGEILQKPLKADTILLELGGAHVDYTEGYNLVQPW